MVMHELHRNRRERQLAGNLQNCELHGRSCMSLTGTGKKGCRGGVHRVMNVVEDHMHELDRNKREKAYRGAVHKVVDIMEGHSEGGEGQHHSLLHIALLEAVAAGPFPETLSTLLQYTCVQTDR